MGSKYIHVIVILSLFLLPLSVFSRQNNIVEELSDGQYATFLSLLNQTRLVDVINGPSTVTVLAVENGAAGALSGKPLNVVKNILSVHIVTDLIDDDKIKQIREHNKSYIVNTLLQSTGAAGEGQGSLYLVPLPNNEIAFQSAVKGSQPDVRYVKKLNKQNPTLSVVQVSSVIQVQGIETINGTTTTPSAPTPKGARAPESPTKNQLAPDSDVPTTDSPAKGISPSEAKSSAHPLIFSTIYNALIVGLVGLTAVF